MIFQGKKAVDQFEIKINRNIVSIKGAQELYSSRISVLLTSQINSDIFKEILTVKRMFCGFRTARIIEPNKIMIKDYNPRSNKYLGMDLKTPYLSIKMLTDFHTRYIALSF